MKVLITGGTGFVGAWTAKAVVEAGHDVRFLVRSPAKLATTVATLDVPVDDFTVGDIVDRASVLSALRGCDAVIHCAAVVATDPKAAEEMLHTNLLGAQNVIGGAAELGLDPIVHASSIAALFDPTVATLTSDLPVAGGKDAYGRSKAEVERYVRRQQDEGHPVCITYPGMVLGPPAGDQFGEAAEGVEEVVAMRAVPGSKAAWMVVDVRDLAALHVALLTPGQGPRRYAAGGARLAARDVADALTVAAGKRIWHVPVPDWTLRQMGKVVDRLPFEHPMTEAAMQYYTQMPASDDRPSQSELGVSYRDPAETLADTVAGLRAVGRLRGS